MAEILIRKIDETTKTLLRRRAARRGVSLEADLRETLQRLAKEEAQGVDDTAPFGSWAVSISRPGVALDDVLSDLRAGRIRPASFD